jgi:manganese efflux pump family protein
MHLTEIIVIAAALAADSFAVSVTSGAIINQMRFRHAIRIALFFSFFQALMPWVGWSIGSIANDTFRAVDHWIAFVMLCFIGGKMIYESRVLKEEQDTTNPLNLYVLISLSIATSIDALAVGFTFSFLDIAIIGPILIIGAVTFFFSLAGAHIGASFGHVFEDKVELIGGLVLIGIGFKILLEHTLFA